MPDAAFRFRRLRPAAAARLPAVLRLALQPLRLPVPEHLLREVRRPPMAGPGAALRLALPEALLGADPGPRDPVCAAVAQAFRGGLGRRPGGASLRPVRGRLPLLRGVGGGRLHVRPLLRAGDTRPVPCLPARLRIKLLDSQWTLNV